MDRYRAQIESLVGALRVTLPDRYRWYGAWSSPVPKHVRARVDEGTWRLYFAIQVRARLYQQFYLPGRAVPAGSSITYAPAPALDESPFVWELIAANRGTGAWQRGWTVVERGAQAVWASRDGLAVWVPATDVRERELPAYETAVRLPKGFRSQSPGFYLAQSDEPFEPSPGDVLVRLYWHVTPAGAIRLISSVTERLNAARAPFQVKVLNDPHTYGRTDAGVLYITRRDLRQAAPLLASIYQDVRADLLPSEPALTRQLAPGVGLAEDPHTGDSFGMHRCGLLVEAFVEAAERGVEAPADVVRLIEQRFEREGLDLARPYLGAGSGDDYAQLLDLPAWRVTASRPVELRGVDGAGSSAPGQRWLAAARAIGDRLVAEAVWFDGRCTWLGELSASAEALSVGNGPAFGAIGGDLYGGTAGIALFLAQLCAETGDERYGRAARGALAQALRRAGQLPDEERLGFYTGWPGIALAAARAGRLLQDPALAQEAPRRLFDQLAPVSLPTSPELLCGSAGAVLAFLGLARLTGDESYGVPALQLGDQLLADARRNASALWWPITLPAGRRALTGFAHGAAGIATALLALFAETGETRFAEASRAAFAFERRNYSARLGNWLDLRYPVRGPRAGPGAMTASVWCHGAGGIALSRLIAWQVLGDTRYLSEARRALDATVAWLETEPSAAPEPWSLCHGLPGNADVLLSAASVLSGQEVALRAAAASAGEAALAAGSAARTSSAPPGSDRPGLMLGLAGLGYFFLRLARPDTLSILLPFPEQLAR